MPISKILDDGRVEIYNSKTGEVKQVQPGELQLYNPKLVGEYMKLKNPSPVEEAATLKAQQEIEKIKAGGTEVGTSEQLFKKASAERAVAEMERTFGRGDAANIGTGKDLSLAGDNASGLNRKSTAAKRAVASFLGINNKTTEDVNKYKAQRDIAIGMLTQAFGSGTPQEGEAKRLIESAPSETSTDSEAKAWFEGVRNLIGTSQKKNELTANSQQNQAQTVTPTPTQTIQPQQPPQENKTVDPNNGEPSKFKQALKGIADAAPIVGGTIGGFGGGILGGTAGSIVPGAGTAAGAIGGSAGGTTIGTGAGVMVKNLIEDIAGFQDESSKEQLGTALKQAGAAGATDAVLGGTFKLVAKAGGMVLKPLAAQVGKIIDEIPLKNFRINPSQLTKFATKHTEKVEEFILRNKLLGENAIDLAGAKAGELQKTFDRLALDLNINVPIDDLNARFIQEIRDLAPSETKLVPSAFKGIAESITSEWQFLIDQMKNKGITQLTPEMLTNLRKATDELVPDSAWVDPSVKNIAIRLRRIYSDVISDSIDKNMIASGGDDVAKGGLKQLGQELSKYYDFLTIAEKQSNLGKGSLLLNLPRLLAGGFGALVGSPGGIGGSALGASAGGLALEALSRDPTVLKGLYTGGKAVGRNIKKFAPAVATARKALEKLTPIIGSVTGTSL